MTNGAVVVVGAEKKGLRLIRQKWAFVSMLTRCCFCVVVVVVAHKFIHVSISISPDTERTCCILLCVQLYSCVHMYIIETGTEIYTTLLPFDLT